MKKNLYRIKPISMMVFWVVLHLCIWPASIMALGAVMLPIIWIFGPILGTLSEIWLLLLVLIAVPISGAIVGLVVGRIQRWLLRNKLYWAADRWTIFSMLGGAVGALMVFGWAFIDDWLALTSDNEIFFTLLAMAIFIVSMSFFQMFTLNDAVKKAWVWVVANIIGGIVFVGVIHNNQTTYYEYYSFKNSVLIPLLAAFAHAIITGYLMLFLFEKHLHPMQPENADELHDERPKSVWDKAI